MMCFFHIGHPHIKGKMRKAEFRVAALIDKIMAAKAARRGPRRDQEGPGPSSEGPLPLGVLDCENSDGFHDPDMAKESLRKSAREAFDGIKVIDEAMLSRTAKSR